MKLPKIKGIHPHEVMTTDHKRKVIDDSLSNHEFTSGISHKKYLRNDPNRYSLSNTKTNPHHYQ